jgi:hypothetical protein
VTSLSIKKLKAETCSFFKKPKKTQPELVNLAKTEKSTQGKPMEKKMPGIFGRFEMGVWPD